MDGRITRARELARDVDDDRIESDAPADAASMLVQTVQQTAYPTVAGRFYAVQEVIPGGNEVEGAVGTYTLVGSIFYALNLGVNVPPKDKPYLIDAASGRWVFRY